MRVTACGETIKDYEFEKSHIFVVFLLNHEEHEGLEVEILLILHDLHALHGKNLTFYEAIKDDDKKNGGYHDQIV